jgi:hypothetical protein
MPFCPLLAVFGCFWPIFILYRIEVTEIRAIRAAKMRRVVERCFRNSQKNKSGHCRLSAADRTHAGSFSIASD